MPLTMLPTKSLQYCQDQMIRPIANIGFCAGTQCQGGQLGIKVFYPHFVDVCVAVQQHVSQLQRNLVLRKSQPRSEVETEKIKSCHFHFVYFLLMLASCTCFQIPTQIDAIYLKMIAKGSHDTVFCLMVLLPCL